MPELPRKPNDLKTNHKLKSGEKPDWWKKLEEKEPQSEMSNRKRLARKLLGRKLFREHAKIKLQRIKDKAQMIHDFRELEFNIAKERFTKRKNIKTLGQLIDAMTLLISSKKVILEYHREAFKQADSTIPRIETNKTAELIRLYEKDIDDLTYNVKKLRKELYTLQEKLLLQRKKKHKQKEKQADNARTPETP